MPMTSTDSVDTDIDEYMVDDSFDLNESRNSSILNIISEIITNELLAENDDQETSMITSNTDELHDSDTETSVPLTYETDNPNSTIIHFCENAETVKQPVQTSELRSVKLHLN